MPVIAGRSLQIDFNALIDTVMQMTGSLTL